MDRPLHTHLSRRESQIMDIVYKLEKATVSDVVARMPDEPLYNSVRVTMSILEEKGYLKHARSGRQYVYSPTRPQEQVGLSELKHLLSTFFKGSTSRAILTLLELPGSRLSEGDLDEISQWIETAKREQGQGERGIQ